MRRVIRRVEEIVSKFPFRVRLFMAIPVIFFAFMFFGIGEIIESINEAIDRLVDIIVSYQIRRQHRSFK